MIHRIFRLTCVLALFLSLSLPSFSETFVVSSTPQTLTSNGFVTFSVPPGAWARAKVFFHVSIATPATDIWNYSSARVYFEATPIYWDSEYNSGSWETSQGQPALEEDATLEFLMAADWPNYSTLAVYTSFYGDYPCSVTITRVELYDSVKITDFAISPPELLLSPGSSPSIEFAATINQPTQVAFAVYDANWNEVYSCSIPTQVSGLLNIARTSWDGKIDNGYVPGWYTVYASVEGDEAWADFEIKDPGSNDSKVISVTADPSPMKVTEDGLPDGAWFKAIGKNVATIAFTVVDSEGNAIFQTTVPTEPIASEGETLNAASYYWDGFINNQSPPVPGDYTVVAEVGSVDNALVAKQTTATSQTSTKRTSAVQKSGSIRALSYSPGPPENGAISNLRIKLAGLFRSVGFTTNDFKNAFDTNEALFNSVDLLKRLASRITPYLGDPVNAVSGNFFFPAVDLTLKSRLPLQLARTYNSSNGQSNLFGRGWSSPYTVHLEFLGSNVIFVDWDGSKTIFHQNEAGLFSSPKGEVFELKVLPNSGNWQLINPCGPMYSFNSQGKALASSRVGLEISSGTSILFSYDDNGRLSRVSNPAGQWFSFAFSDKGLVSSVTDSAGRSVSYEYSDKGYLTAFIDVLGRRTQYSYDRNGFLTAFVKPDGSTPRSLMKAVVLPLLCCRLD